MWKVAAVWIAVSCTIIKGEEKLDDYFPLTAGAAWKYRVSIKKDNAEPQTTEQTVSVETQKHGGKAFAVASENAYAAQDDGVYIVGVVRNGKLEALDEPQKVVPAEPKMGDKWTYRELAGVTSATCLGTEKVKVGAGEYDAVKVYVITVGGAGGTDRKDVYRWFARGVGPVKGVVTQRVRNADGSPATVEITMELISFQGAQGDVAREGVAGPTVESLFAQGEAAARKGDHKTALAQYDAALGMDPKASKVYAYKTLSLIALKQFEEGERAINRAMALNDKEYTYVEIAGQLKVAQGKIGEGKGLYEKAAKLSPANAGAVYTDLAAALAGRNDNQLAPEIDQALKAAAQADPPSAEALFALGQSYVNAGRAEGKKFLQRYVEVASKLPEGKRDEQKIRLAKQLIRAIDAVKG